MFGNQILNSKLFPFRPKWYFRFSWYLYLQVKSLFVEYMTHIFSLQENVLNVMDVLESLYIKINAREFSIASASCKVFWNSLYSNKDIFQGFSWAMFSMYVLIVHGPPPPPPTMLLSLRRIFIKFFCYYFDFWSLDSLSCSIFVAHQLQLS